MNCPCGGHAMCVISDTYIVVCVNCKVCVYYIISHCLMSPIYVTEESGILSCDIFHLL